MHGPARPAPPGPPAWLDLAQPSVNWAIALSLFAIIIHFWHTSNSLHRWSRQFNHVPVLRSLAWRWLLLAGGVTALLAVISLDILAIRGPDAIQSLIALSALLVSAFAAIVTGFALAHWAQSLSNENRLPTNLSMR